MHTTNYRSTLILVAEDCTAERATPPPGDTTVAARQYRMLIDAPYQYTSDDVIFTVHADRKEIPADERAAARESFFSKGQPCLRTSPLAKTYGYGIHHDDNERIALVPRESDCYAELERDPSITTVRAMRSGKAK